PMAADPTIYRRRLPGALGAAPAARTARTPRRTRRWRRRTTPESRVTTIARRVAAVALGPSAPVLLMHGSADSVVPVAQSREYDRTVRALGPRTREMPPLHIQIRASRQRVRPC